MNPAVVGWGLAALAVAAGYWTYGWPGVVLAVTMIVFWLLLQFSRALRVMRQAGHRPVGEVDSAVMLQAKLRRGHDADAGHRADAQPGPAQAAIDPETWTWTDPGGASVVLTMQDAKLATWQLVRPAE